MNGYQKDGCLTCNTFPYLEATGMCAACTFGEAEAQIEMLSCGMEGTVWERDKVNGICEFKIRDRDSVIEILEAMGVSFKQHNNGLHLRIDTNRGVVDYYPTTRKVRYKGAMTYTLYWVNTDHSSDIIGLIKEFGYEY